MTPEADDVSPAGAIALADAKRLIESAAADVARALDGLVESVETTLEKADAELTVTTAGLTGAVERQLGVADGLIVSQVDRLIKVGDKVLNEAYGSVSNGGAVLPWSVVDMRAALDADDGGAAVLSSLGPLLSVAEGGGGVSGGSGGASYIDVGRRMIPRGDGPPPDRVPTGEGGGWYCVTNDIGDGATITSVGEYPAGVPYSVTVVALAGPYATESEARTACLEQTPPPAPPPPEPPPPPDLPPPEPPPPDSPLPPPPPPVDDDPWDRPPLPPLPGSDPPPPPTTPDEPIDPDNPFGFPKPPAKDGDCCAPIVVPAPVVNVSPSQSCPTPPDVVVNNEIKLPPPPAPPPPPPYSSRPYDVGGFPPVNTWDSIAACRRMRQDCGTASPPTTGSGAGGSAIPWISETARAEATETSASYPNWMRTDGKNAKDSQESRDRINGTSVAAGMADYVLSAITGSAIPNKTGAIQFGGVLAAAASAERLSGFPLTYLTQATLYSYQYCNPQYLPSQAEVDELYISGQIDKQVFQCLTAAHGNLPNWRELVTYVKRARPGPNELVSLMLRGAIDPADLTGAMHDVGVNETYDINHYLKLAEFVPGPSDLTRFMTRDVADDRVSAKYDYDKDFGAKFAGPIKAWAKAQGMDESQFKYFWRAHWEIPPPEQLYRMLHRLRPDRKAVTDWVNKNGPVNVNEPGVGDNDAPPVVTIDDVREALEINDKAPAWINRLLAISYHPITRTDAIDAYMTGAFDYAETFDAFRDNGYSNENAELLMRMLDTKKEVRIRNQSGTLTARKIMTLFKQGAMTREEAKGALEPLIADEGTRDTLLDGGELERDAEVAARSIKTLKAEYAKGIIDQAEFRQLIKFYVKDERARRAVEEDGDWLRSGRRRLASASMLCKWRTQGLINADQHVKYLLNLNFSPVDVGRITASCEKGIQKIAEAAAAKALKEAKAAQKERLRQQKECIKDPELCERLGIVPPGWTPDDTFPLQT